MLLTGFARSRWQLWAVAGGTSVLLLAVVLWQVDWSQTVSLVKGASEPVLGAAFLLLLSEGLFSALRTRVLVTGQPGLFQTVRATAWHMLLLITLPARLGEVAAVGVYHRFLGESVGAVAMNVLVQRCFDVAVLATIFVLSGIVISGLVDNVMLWVLMAFLVVMLIFTLSKLDVVLASVAAPLRSLRLRKWPRRLLVAVLQARRWHRRHLTRTIAASAIVWTLGKWMAILGGVCLVLAAIELPLTTIHALFLGAAYNFLAAVPLQTIGGIGLGEVGFTGLLISADVDLGVAAGVAVLLRAILLVVPVLFFSCVALISAAK